MERTVVELTYVFPKQDKIEKKSEPVPERMFKAHLNGVDSVVDSVFFLFFTFVCFYRTKTTKIVHLYHCHSKVF